MTVELILFDYVQKSSSPRISGMRCTSLCLWSRPSGDLGTDGRQARPAFLGSTDISQVGHEFWLQGIC